MGQMITDCIKTKFSYCRKQMYQHTFHRFFLTNVYECVTRLYYTSENNVNLIGCNVRLFFKSRVTVSKST